MSNLNPLGGVFRINDALSADAAVQIARTEHHITDTICDNLNGAVQLKQGAGVVYAVYRETGWEPAPGNDPKATAKTIHDKLRGLHNSVGKAPIHYMVNCEQNWTDARNFMYAELIRLNSTHPEGPIGLVVGNYSSGSIKSGQGQDPNWWTEPGAKALLDALFQYKSLQLVDGTYANILGIHNYTSLYPYIATNGGIYAKDWQTKAPATIDWTLPQWHLGREIQGIRAVRDGALPWLIITEGFFDYMEDSVKAYEQLVEPVVLTPPYTSARGWRSLVEFWKKHRPGVSSEELLFNYHVWIWNRIFRPFPEVFGSQVFIYGTGFEGDQFRVDNADEYQKLNESFAPGSTGPLPPPPEEIPSLPPAGAKAVPRLIDTPKDFVNIRSLPGTVGKVVGQAVDMQWALVYLDTPFNGWYYITTDNAISGWVSSQNGAVKFVDKKLEYEDVLDLVDDLIELVEKLSIRVAAQENKPVVLKNDMMKYAEDLMAWSATQFVTKKVLKAAAEA